MNLMLKSAAAVATAVLEDPTPEIPIASPAIADPDDAQLIALGERLKVASAEADQLKPDRLYQACRKAAGSYKVRTEKGRMAAEQRFNAMAEQNGYHEAFDKWSAAAAVERQIAEAILQIPSHTRIGAGVRAAAMISDGGGVYCEDAEVLWEMAACAGFRLPAAMAKKLKQNAVARRKQLTGRAPPDPIFAAIARSRKTRAKHRAAVHEVRELEVAHRTANGDLPTTKGHPALLKLQRKRDRASSVDADAARELCATVPTTFAGMLAMLQYADETKGEILVLWAGDQEDDHRQTGSVFLGSIRSAVERLASEQIAA